MAVADRRLVVGRVVGLFGVRGWIRVYSYTEPMTNLIGYRPWQLATGSGWRTVELEAGRSHGKGLIAKLEGFDDRDAAATLLGADIAVQRRQLPPPEPGEYYWADLVGLRVMTNEGTDLGVVDGLFATGANDVLVVLGERERLIPFVPGQVMTGIDIEGGTLTVDWDPDF